MMDVVITDTKARRWNWFRRRVFRFQVPQAWHEVQDPRRWFAVAIADPARARAALLRTLIPWRLRARMGEADWAALLLQLNWVDAQSNCTNVPVAKYRHRGRWYYGPQPDGASTTCGEFAVADEHYRAAVKGDQTAAQTLAAILYREADTDTAAANKRGDVRVPFFHQNEATARVQQQGEIPPDIQVAAMLYFSGLKAWVSRVYGPYIFDQQDDDDTPGLDNVEPDHTPQPTASNGPNFGWWGVLQGVAESGTFGTLEQVYQAGLHEVCIFLVRKKAEHDRAMEQIRANSPQTNTLA